MANQLHSRFISKESFLKLYPSLYYGVSEEWFVVMTPDEQVCALALKSFPNVASLLKRYQKHILVEKPMFLKNPLPCLLAGTSFQHQVWQALLEIPHGVTWSYLQLATHLQKPKAVRAVANAVGANPISPLIPCHRVVRSHGYIGGYYWGTPAKLALLQKEGVAVELFKKPSL